MKIRSARRFASALLAVVASGAVLAACDEMDDTDLADARMDVRLPDAVAIPDDEPLPFFDELVPLDGIVERPAVNREGDRVYFAHHPPAGDHRLIFYIEGDEQGWAEPVPLPLPADDPLRAPSLSPDGNFLLFNTSRDAPDVGAQSIWASQWDGQGWGDPVPLPGVNSIAMDVEPSMSGNGRLVLASERDGPGFDLYVTELDGGAFGEPSELSGVNSPNDDRYASIAPDGTFIVFASDRNDPGGNHDLYVTYQEDGSWGEPEPLDAVNTDADEYAPTISPRGQFLFFNRGEEDIYWVTLEAAGIQPPAPAAEGPEG